MSKFGQGNQKEKRSGTSTSRGRKTDSKRSVEILFNPQESLTNLVDNLAEQQAKSLEILTSSQLRKFFGEVKDLYRRWKMLEKTAGESNKLERYQEVIEPQLKMLRSKAYYAIRLGGQQQIPESFRDFIDKGIEKIKGPGDFEKFVKHFEAIVGFLYGLGRVKKS